MLEDVVGFLRCPHCAGGLAPGAGALRCSHGHAFDIARHGYVSLLAGRLPAEPPDTPAMVAARAAFLGAGHFEPIARGLADAAERAVGDGAGGCVVDFGAGPGYYLAAVLSRLSECPGIALDISKPALRRAARAHPRIGAVACDVRGTVPVRTGVARLALDVFAPRNPPEMRRILASDGALIVVTPGPDHLRELVAPLGLLTVHRAKRERMDESLRPRFRLESRESLAFTLALDHAAIEAVAGMGPSAWHLDVDEIRSRLTHLVPPVPATAAVEFAVYRPTSGA